MPAHPMLRLSSPVILTMAVLCTLQAQWMQQKSGTTSSLTDVVALSATTALAVARDGSILKTTDAGETWMNLPLLPLFFHPWNSISFSSEYFGSVAGDFGRLATTTDAGGQWRWHTLPGGRTCLSVLAVRPGILYAGDDSGWVHHSLDTGATWSSEHISTSPIRSLFPWTGAFIWGLPVHALTPTSLFGRPEFPPGPWKETVLNAFVGLGSEAFRGAFCNGGGAGFIVGVQGDLRAAPAIVRKALSDTAWKTVPTGLPGDGTLYGVSAPSTKTIYVCGDRGMIFRSSDGGDSWSASAVPTTRRLKAISFADDLRGFAVGDSGTILHTSNGGMTDVHDAGLLPLIPVLYQNYPNPFNPTTTIRYSLPMASDVRLSVYDVLGREVSVIVQERREAGVHEVTFDASGLSSGVYYYSLQAGEFTQTRRLMLLK